MLPRPHGRSRDDRCECPKREEESSWPVVSADRAHPWVKSGKGAASVVSAVRRKEETFECGWLRQEAAEKQQRHWPPADTNQTSIVGAEFGMAQSGCHDNAGSCLIAVPQLLFCLLPEKARPQHQFA